MSNVPQGATKSLSRGAITRMLIEHLIKRNLCPKALTENIILGIILDKDCHHNKKILLKPTNDIHFEK